MDAPCKNPGCCVFGFFCQCCAACNARENALTTLGGGLPDYVCCQV
jgi:hypothetical protein